MRKALGIAIRWLVAAGILFYLFRYKIQPDKLWGTVREMNWVWVLAAVGLYAVTFIGGACRWQLLLRSQQIRIPLGRVLRICFVGQFFNAFMLGGTGGDIVKAYYAAHQTDTRKPEAITSVIMDRLVGLTGLFMIVLIMLGLNLTTVQGHPTLWWLASVVVWIIGITLIIIPISFWPGSMRWLGWLKRVAGQWPVMEHLRRAVRSYRSYAQHRRVLVQAWVWSLVVHASNFVGAAFIGKGLGITGVGWNEYFLLVPLINTVASLPITIAGFGVREEMYRRTFGEFGVATEPAVALGIGNYCVQLVWSLIGGIIYIFWKHEPALWQHARRELADKPRPAP